MTTVEPKDTLNEDSSLFIRPDSWGPSGDCYREVSLNSHAFCGKGCGDHTP